MQKTAIAGHITPISSPLLITENDGLLTGVRHDTTLQEQDKLHPIADLTL